MKELRNAIGAMCAVPLPEITALHAAAGELRAAGRQVRSLAFETPVSKLLASSATAVSKFWSGAVRAALRLRGCRSCGGAWRKNSATGTESPVPC